nr:MAG TPA: HICA protein [Caudoviricetes sp.]
MDSKFFRQYRITRNEVIFTNYKKFLALVKVHGFKRLRDGKGSHEIWANDNGDTFTIPKGKMVHKGIVWNFQRNYC